uniref:GPI-anchored wall transfer protein 1 n=1 Tax=Parastrongyloides trichosuri TaxID=131310 RepID=A0A0N4ZNF0_PARTI
MTKKSSNKDNKVPEYYYVEFDCLRTCILIPTAIAILAVDFQIFPRSWGKTEYFGYSVMDVGTSGAFMMMGVGDEIALQKRQNNKVSIINKENSMIKNIPSWFLLFIIGIFRTISVYFINYHSHTSEYGIHWNFFITMGCVIILSNVIGRHIGVKTIVFSLILNWILLRFFKLQEWGLCNDNSRDNLISANKEGIISVLGYFTIYQLYRMYGKYLINIKKSKENESYLPTLKIISISLIFFTLQLISEIFIGPPSRRVFNITFFLYTVRTFIIFHQKDF